MDDLDHSVYIAEQDWNAFFLESEECNLQQAALAGLDESGLSDFDDAEFRLSNQEEQARPEASPLGSRHSIDGAAEFKDLPDEPYLSVEALCGPEDALPAGQDGEHLETVRVLFDRLTPSVDGEGPANLNHPRQASSQNFSKESSLDKPGESAQPVGACCATSGGEVHHETARDSQGIAGPISPETEIKTNATAALFGLSVEMFTQEDKWSVEANVESEIHISNNDHVKFALSSSPTGNECGNYGAPSEGESISALKESQQGIHVGTEESVAGQSFLARPSASFFDPQKDLQMKAEAQPCANLPAEAGHFKDCAEPTRKEKERWFVTMDVGQMHSREKTWPSVKKKRRKKRRSEDALVTDHAVKGQDPSIPSNSGAERLGASELERNTMDSTPDHSPPDCRAHADESGSIESTESTMPTLTHELNNNPNILMPSHKHLPVSQIISGGFEECKEDDQKSQHVDDSQEQQKVVIGHSLQMNFVPDDKSAAQQNYNMPESSQPTCVVVSDWTEPTATVASIPPSHQNLLVKLLFSAQSDTGCEMLVFCKNSDRENLPGSQEEQPSQGDVEADSKCKTSLHHTLTDGTYNVPEHSTFSPDTSISIKSPEGLNRCFLETIPGFMSIEKSNQHSLSALGCKEMHPEETDKLNLETHSLDKSTNAGSQQVDSLASKRGLLEVQQMTELPQITVSEYNDGPELNLLKECVAPGPKTQKDDSFPDHREVKTANDELIYLKETSLTGLCGAKSDDAKYSIPEKDSTLSASENTQPPTVTKDDSCLPMAGQQSTVKQPYLEPATLHPIDPTISNECPVEVCLNNHSIVTPRDYSHDPNGNKDNHTGDSLWLKTESTTQADSAECVTTATFPECVQSPLDAIGGKALDLQSETTLAEDTLAAGLSAVDTLQHNTKNIKEDEPALPQEPMTWEKELESKELDQELVSTRPVYAISSFWDEMEKLTINDILHLRLVSNAQYPREYPHPLDATGADVSDAADSGYFPHPDDSKPDHSSGDASLFSDFEEEFLQTLNTSTNPSPEPQDTKLRSPEPSSVWWESEPDPVCVGSDIDTEETIALRSDGTIPQPLFSESAQCFRTLCKNVTVQNLQTLEAESQSFQDAPLPIIVREEEESNMLFCLCPRSEETCDLVLMEHGNDVECSPPPFLSGAASSESYVISFPEISQHVFDEGEAEASLSDRASPVVALYDRESPDLSLPETYDYFFSDYEVGKIFGPPIWRPSSHMNTAVPIFSCSRWVTQKRRFTEEYDDFFPEESPVESEDEQEDERALIRVVTRFDSRVCEPLDVSAGPEMYEHFFTDKDWRGDFFWRNPLSLRRVGLAGGLFGSCDGSTSWASAATRWGRKSLFRTMNPGNTMDDRGSNPPLPNIFYLRNQIGSEFTEQQRGTELQAVVPIPKKEGFFFTLKQSDMCLVCIAFASWVLRSANPQSENTWKTALLANVSAISAIRYLRRYISEGATEEKR